MWVVASLLHWTFFSPCFVTFFCRPPGWAQAEGRNRPEKKPTNLFLLLLLEGHCPLHPENTTSNIRNHLRRLCDWLLFLTSFKPCGVFLWFFIIVTFIFLLPCGLGRWENTPRGSFTTHDRRKCKHLCSSNQKHLHNKRNNRGTGFRKEPEPLKWGVIEAFLSSWFSGGEGGNTPTWSPGNAPRWAADASWCLACSSGRWRCTGLLQRDGATRGSTPAATTFTRIYSSWSREWLNPKHKSSGGNFLEV